MQSGNNDDTSTFQSVKKSKMIERLKKSLLNKIKNTTAKRRMTVDHTKIIKFDIIPQDSSQAQSMKDLLAKPDVNNRYEPINVESILSDDY